MKTNNSKIPLDKKTMKNMLPDYLFHKLTAEEMTAFESSLPYYPDIINELNDIKNTFSSLDKTLIEENFSQKTKNLSVKVNERLNYTKKYTYFDQIFKKLIPALTAFVIIALIAIFFIIQNEDSNNSSIIQNYKILNTELNQDEINTIVDYANNEEILLVETNINEGIAIPKDKEIEENIEDIYNQIISENIFEYLENGKNPSNSNIKTELDMIKNIEELNDIQYEILEKELKNAKI